MIKCAIFDLDGMRQTMFLKSMEKIKNGRFPITECSSEMVPKSL